MSVDLERSVASGFQPFTSKGFGQSQHAHAGSVSLFGVFTLAHNDLDKDFSIGTNPRCLTPDLFWRPVIAEPMMSGHMVLMGGMLVVVLIFLSCALGFVKQTLTVTALRFLYLQTLERDW